MNYRTLGKTNFKISEIGFGSWQLANDPNCWVGSDLNESLQSLYRFVELGGNFIDTAWVYGYDDKFPDKHPSEELIGKFLKDSNNKNNIIVATKIPPKNFLWPAPVDISIDDVFPINWIESCVNDSLKSLGLDCLDLVQFHVWQDDFVNRDEWKQTIQKLTKEGKVKYWGISTNNYQPINCFKALDTGLISTVQSIFNIFHQEPTKELLPYAQEHNIGLIVRVPLDEGGLSGKFTLDTKFADGDFRNRYFNPDRLKQLIEHTDKLKLLLGAEAKTLSELDLRYILSHPPISTVIPGMRRIAYVEANMALSDGRVLSPSLMEELKKHIWERNFYN